VLRQTVYLFFLKMAAVLNKKGGVATMVEQVARQREALHSALLPQLCCICGMAHSRAPGKDD
jgi:hypothetical protein